VDEPPEGEEVGSPSALHFDPCLLFLVETGSVFFDAGWGSYIAACRKALGDAFLNLRLSPIRMLQCTPAEMASDVEKLLLAAGPLDKAGVCCINMDYGTPDDNLFAVYEVIERYRRYGA